MDDITNLILKSIFVDNMVYTYFLGMCSYLAVSKKLTPESKAFSKALIESL